MCLKLEHCHDVRILPAFHFWAGLVSQRICITSLLGMLSMVNVERLNTDSSSQGVHLYSIGSRNTADFGGLWTSTHT